MDWKPQDIRRLRKRLGYNQTEMADALGYGSYQRVSELENGKRDAPATVQRLLDMLEKQAPRNGTADD